MHDVKRQLPALTIPDFYSRVQAEHPRQTIAAPVGNPKANVVFVGDGVTTPMERSAFTRGPNKAMVDVLTSIGVRSDAVYLTYMVKTFTRLPDSTVRRHWSRILAQELALLQPRAVLFFGRDVFKWFTGIDNSIDKLRHTRFGYDEHPETNFFVTHDIVVEKAAHNEEGRTELRQDVLAVLRANADHFQHMVSLPTMQGVPFLEAIAERQV